MMHLLSKQKFIFVFLFLGQSTTYQCHYMGRRHTEHLQGALGVPSVQFLVHPLGHQALKLEKKERKEENKSDWYYESPSITPHPSPHPLPTKTIPQKVNIESRQDKSYKRVKVKVLLPCLTTFLIVMSCFIPGVVGETFSTPFLVLSTLFCTACDPGLFFSAQNSLEKASPLLIFLQLFFLLIAGCHKCLEKFFIVI